MKSFVISSIDPSGIVTATYTFDDNSTRTLVVDTVNTNYFSDVPTFQLAVWNFGLDYENLNINVTVPPPISSLVGITITQP